jgi:hypothetical protein
MKLTAKVGSKVWLKPNLWDWRKLCETQNAVLQQILRACADIGITRAVQKATLLLSVFAGW